MFTPMTRLGRAAAGLLLLGGLLGACGSSAGTGLASSDGTTTTAGTATTAAAGTGGSAGTATGAAAGAATTTATTAVPAGNGPRSATDGGPIDVSVSAQIQGTIQTALDTHTYTFTGVKGQELSLNVTGMNGGTCQLKDEWNFTIGVWDTTDDSPVNNWSHAGCRVFGPSELPADGSYAIRVESKDASPGSYKVTISTLTRPVKPITLAAAAPTQVTGAITVPLDYDRYTFAGTKGQKLSVNVTAINGTCALKDEWKFNVGIWDAKDGSPVNNWSQAGCRVFGPSELPADGTYELRVTSGDAAPGRYQIALGIVR